MINKVILVGNVGVDPEVRAMESGVKVARVRLATSERMYNRQTNETTEHTEWHTVTLWRGLAETVDRFVRKGSQLYIEGRLRTREWTDKDNNKRYTTEILADEMKLLGRRSDSRARRRDRATASRRSSRHTRSRSTASRSRRPTRSLSMHNRRRSLRHRPCPPTIRTICRSDGRRDTRCLPYRPRG